MVQQKKKWPSASGPIFLCILWKKFCQNEASLEKKYRILHLLYTTHYIFFIHKLLFETNNSKLPRFLGIGKKLELFIFQFSTELLYLLFLIKIHFSLSLIHRTDCGRKVSIKRWIFCCENISLFIIMWVINAV